MRDLIELYNDDGTLAGYAFEPTEAEKAAAEAWLVPNQVPQMFHNTFMQWNRYLNGNPPKQNDYQVKISSRGENHPAVISYRGCPVSGY